MNWLEKWRVESGGATALLSKFGSSSGGPTITPTVSKLRQGSLFRVRSWWSDTKASSSSSLDLVLRLTLIDLLLRPMGPWFVRAPLLLASALGLISPAVLRSPITWFTTFGLIALRIAVDWPLPDNHIFLLGYWSLALAIALAGNRSRSAATSARWLIGLAFTFAVIWKGLLSPEYRDGRFFAITFLTDDRFADAVVLLTGLSESDLQNNRSFLEPLPGGAAWFDRELIETAAFRTLVSITTWATLALEATIAALFLAPIPASFQIWRHILLLTFCVVTYAFAPVAGFGWLLLIMGLAMCQPDQKRLCVAYVLVYFLILLYSETPWAGLILDWTGR